jgi:hypothetical protein
MLASYFDYRTACVGLILTGRLINRQHAPPPTCRLAALHLVLLDGASNATGTPFSAMASLVLSCLWNQLKRSSWNYDAESLLTTECVVDYVAHDLGLVDGNKGGANLLA